MADNWNRHYNNIPQRNDDALFIPMRIKRLKEYYELKKQLYEAYGQERIDCILAHSTFAEGVEGLQALKEKLECFEGGNLAEFWYT